MNTVIIVIYNNNSVYNKFINDHMTSCDVSATRTSAELIRVILTTLLKSLFVSQWLLVSELYIYLYLFTYMIDYIR